MSENLPAEMGSSAFTDAFEFVQRCFINTGELLKTGDVVLGQRNWQPYEARWTAVPPVEGGLKVWNAAEWLPYYAVRQYFRKGRQYKEVLTVSAFLWDRRGGRKDLPWCLASYASLAACDSNEVYWLPLCQRRSAHGADGKIHELREADLIDYDEDARARFRRVIRDGLVTSIAVPLLDVTSVGDLEQKVLAPLLGAIESAR